MSRGELVSDELVLSIVENKLEITHDDGWLLDGFPRNLAQAQALESLLVKIDQPIQAVLLLELNDEALIQRLLSRGRADDNEKVIRHRLEVYRDQTAPLIDYYNKSSLIRRVKGDGKIFEIATRIEEELN